MSESPWNKNLFLKSKIPPASNQPSQLPTTVTPIQLNLSSTSLVYENGQWKPSKFYEIFPILKNYSADISSNSSEVVEQSKKLKAENTELQERNNLLEFKFQLLLDMV